MLTVLHAHVAQSGFSNIIAYGFVSYTAFLILRSWQSLTSCPTKQSEMSGLGTYNGRPMLGYRWIFISTWLLSHAS